MKMKKTYATAREILDAIGKPRLRNGLGVNDRTINDCGAQGKITASWFDFCEKATGRKLPRHLFTFKGMKE